MYLSDLLDGYLARKLNQISELGKIIDPLADKISVITISLILLKLNRLAGWFVAIVVMRDLLILGFGTYLSRKKNLRLMSNYPGKVAVFVIGIILLFAISGSEILLQVNQYLYFISLAMIFYSSYLYYRRYREAMAA